MNLNLERVRHNQQRMKILKVLNNDKVAGIGREVDFDTLYEACGVMGLPLIPKQLDYHLRFMAGKSWVMLRLGESEDRMDAILGITLTVRGVDRIDIGKMPELEG